MCALYYYLKNGFAIDPTNKGNNLNHNNTNNKEILKSCLDILPNEKLWLIEQKKFGEIMLEVIKEWKKKHSIIIGAQSQSNPVYQLNNISQIHQSTISLIHSRVMTLADTHYKINTFFVPVNAYSIPQ